MQILGLLGMYFDSKVVFVYQPFTFIHIGYGHTVNINLATMYHLILSHISRKSRDWFLKEGQIVCQSPLMIDFFCRAFRLDELKN